MTTDSSNRVAPSVRHTPAVRAHIAHNETTRIVTLAVFAAIVGLCWWRTIDDARSMGSMVQGLAQAGTGMPFDMNVFTFIGMWATMMTAMMLPTIISPQAASRSGDVHASPFSATLFFAGGYLAIWASTGVVPFALLVTLRHITSSSTAITWIGGAAFVVAGAYEFTAWKQRALTACRRAKTLASPPSTDVTASQSFLAGASDGGWCLAG